MVAYTMASLMADSDVRAGSIERHGRLERADRARVEGAQRRERLAQQLPDHVQAVLGDGNAGGRDAGAQLVHRQVGALRLVGHGVLLWGSNDTSCGVSASAAEGGHRALIVRQLVVLLGGLPLGAAPLDLRPPGEPVAQALHVPAPGPLGARV